jgi:multiple sugar transport system permease protein
MARRLTLHPALNRFSIALFLGALAASALARPVVLRLSSWEGDEALRVQRKAISEFEAAHPGIKVKLENNDYGVYFQKLLAQVASGTAPDVSMMTFEHFQSFGKRKVLLPLDELAAQDHFDLTAYYPQMIEAHRYAGRLYVLPRDIAPHGLVFYNRKLFREAGLAYPRTSWTWDYQERPELKEQDFLYVIHKLTKFDPDGKVLRWGFANTDNDWMARTFAYSQGAKVVDDYENPKRVLYDSDTFIRSYEFTNHLAFDLKYIPTASELNTILQTGASDLFAQGRVAMMLCGEWEVPKLRSLIVPGTPGFFDWDMTIMPAFKDGRRAFSTGGSGYAILASSSHPKESWELVKWLSGPRGMLGLAESGLAQPALRRLAQSEPWLVGPNTPEQNRYPLHREIADEAVQYVVFPPTSEYWNDLLPILLNRIGPIWSREDTPRNALTRGTREAQQRLDALNKVESAPPFPWLQGFAFGGLLFVALAAWVFWPSANRKPKSASRIKANRAAYLFLSPWLIGLLLFTAGPMLLSLLMSFTDWDMILPARSRGLGNYSEAFLTDPKFWISLRVTGIYTFVSVPVGLVASLAIALLLNQKVRGMPIFRTCFYIPTVGSAVATALIWKRLFQPETGLINTVIYGFNGKGNFLGLATALQPLVPPGQHQVDWLGSEKTALSALIIMSLWGFGGVLVLLAGLQGIPQHYYEAATLDGAGPRARFRHVTLPLLSPAIFFSLVTGFIGSFQTFTQTYVLTAGGPGDATQFYMLNLYQQAFNSLRMGYASALAWILFFIILGFTILQFQGSRWVYTEAG